MQSTRIYGVGRNSDRYISFEAEPDILLNDYDAYVKYVKAIEETMRADDRYHDYISHLHESGLNYCAILGNVTTGGKKVSLEIHHGPIFLASDYADIVLKYHLRKNDMDSITTFDIVDELLTCHEKNWVMLVALSKSAHTASHGTILLDIKASVGRLDKFIDKYHEGMEAEHWEMIEKYLREYEKISSTTDQGLFDTYKKLKSFK